jgi:hypothetical protein
MLPAQGDDIQLLVRRFRLPHDHPKFGFAQTMNLYAERLKGEAGKLSPVRKPTPAFALVVADAVEIANLHRCILVS